MLDPVARVLGATRANRFCVGQVIVRRIENRFLLSHRDDEDRKGLQILQDISDVFQIARYDEAGKYRPLKTAPDLRRGWQLEVIDVQELERALDRLYPGRLAVFGAWKENRLVTTALRTTLDRQSGMYRVAAKISDEKIDAVVGDFCRSNGGCLRTILWKRDDSGAVASAKLPDEKFDPNQDQVAPGGPKSTSAAMIPLLCQEACNLLVAECRNAVKCE